jgi:hypothetical protein
MARNLCACAHQETQHTSHPSGARPCTSFGCGCSDYDGPRDPFLAAPVVSAVARMQREARAQKAAKAARAGRLAAAYLRGHGDTCPSCHTVALLSDKAEGGLEFSEPLCAPCRARYVFEAQLTDWDREYERARVNGWED